MDRSSMKRSSGELKRIHARLVVKKRASSSWLRAMVYKGQASA